MSAGLVLGIVSAAAALLFVLLPLLRGEERPEEAARAAAGVPSLERLRDELYAAIVELDFDHAVGKTDEEEYQRERAELKRQALAVLRLLDEGEADVAGRLDDAIERDVALARRERAAAASEPATLACPACGRTLKADDRFCSRCGRPVEAGATAPLAEADAIEREVLALRRQRAARPATIRVSGGRSGRGRR